MSSRQQRSGRSRPGGSSRSGSRNNRRGGGGSGYRSNDSSPDSSYRQHSSPRGRGGGRTMNDDQFRRAIGEIQKALQQFQEVTKSIENKIALLNTKQDTRSNHERLNEDVERGKRLTTKLKNKVTEVAEAGKRKQDRQTQARKVANAFRSQMEKFDRLCKKVVNSEQNAVDFIRRSSVPRPKSNKAFDFKNVSEDQLYAQVEITSYDEDDLQRREEDIIHISHQMKEVNAAYRELDGLIIDQDEAVIEIAENTDQARDNVERGLDQVQKADKKTKYCNCTKRKCICYGILLVMIGILVLVLVVQK